MPLSAGCMLLAGLALRGLPFLGGFYSKDLIVEGFLGGELNVFIVGVIGVGLCSTLVYRIRLYFRGVFGSVGYGPIQRVERSSYYEVIPLFSLGLASVVGGYFIQSIVFPFNEVVLLEVGFKLFMVCVLVRAVVLLRVRVLVKSVFSVGGFLVSFFSTI